MNYLFKNHTVSQIYSDRLTQLKINNFTFFYYNSVSFKDFQIQSLPESFWSVTAQSITAECSCLEFFCRNCMCLHINSAVSDEQSCNFHICNFARQSSPTLVFWLVIDLFNTIIGITVPAGIVAIYPSKSAGIIIPSAILGDITSLNFAFGLSFACSNIFTKNAANSALVAGLFAFM